MKISIKLFYLLILTAFISSCNDDEVSSPPASTIQVDKTTGLVSDTEFTFTVSFANASSITILPKGVDQTGKAGILLSKSQFSGGSATIKYTYDEPGVFAPVVVTSNFTPDGKSVKRSVSAPLSVTVKSDDKEISEFTFDKSDSTKINQGAGTISVYVPYDPFGISGVTALKAKFKSSAFSTVKVGATTQVSGETSNNFTSPVSYVVTANDGTTKTYSVTVIVKAIETINTVKSFGAKSTSKGAGNKVLGAFVDNTSRKIVIQGPAGITDFDSLSVNYALNGKFAQMLYGANDAVLAQDALINFATSKTVKVKAQDASIANYSVYAVTVPKLELAFNALIPKAEGTNSDFEIAINVLTGTDVAGLITTSTITAAAGVTVTSIKADGALFVSGGALDFTEPVEFELTVNDTNIGVIYTVVYTAKVTVLP